MELMLKLEINYIVLDMFVNTLNCFLFQYLSDEEFRNIRNVIETAFLVHRWADLKFSI